MYTPYSIALLDTHDYVFWCGDLNYRIELEKSVTENYIEKSDWMVRGYFNLRREAIKFISLIFKPLLLKDQLSREMLAGLYPYCQLV